MFRVSSVHDKLSGNNSLPLEITDRTARKPDGKKVLTMNQKSHRAGAALLFVALLTNALPVRAGAILYDDTKQVLKGHADGKQSPEILISSTTTGANHGKAGEAAKKSEPHTSLLPPVQQVISEGTCGSQTLVQIDLCDVTGTVCEDCGEIMLASEVLPEYAEVRVPAGGLPRLPFILALAGVPIALIPLLRRSRGPEVFRPGLPDTPQAPNPLLPPPSLLPPADTPPPAPIPEPVSLLLLGTGLAALCGMARRRRAAAKRAAIDLQGGR